MNVPHNQPRVKPNENLKLISYLSQIRSSCCIFYILNYYKL